MVHALEKIHTLLRPGGILIDIHPTAERATVEVHLDGRIVHAGWLKEDDDLADIRQTDWALAEVARRGLFVIERTGNFIWHTYTDTVAELSEHFPTWSKTDRGRATIQQAGALLAGPGRNKEIVFRENVHILCLRAV